MEQMTVNEQGGRQHSVEHRCEALFPRAILAVAKLRKEGYERHGYADNNYLNIPATEHIGRALRHTLLYLSGNKEDGDPKEHIVHAMCRLMMAYEEMEIDQENEAERQESELEQLRLEYGYESDRMG